MTYKPGTTRLISGRELTRNAVHWLDGRVFSKFFGDRIMRRIPTTLCDVTILPSAHILRLSPDLCGRVEPTIFEIVCKEMERLEHLREEATEHMAAASSN